MNFLEKLDFLMKRNNLNKSTLSKACDIPYTTIDGWYKKGYEGLKLTTLRKLADYFNTSLDYWATENSKKKKEAYPSETDELMLICAQLNDDGRGKVINYAQDLVNSGNYKIEKIRPLKEQTDNSDSEKVEIKIVARSGDKLTRIVDKDEFEKDILAIPIDVDSDL